MTQNKYAQIAEATTSPVENTMRKEVKIKPMCFMEILIGGPYSGHIYGHTALRIKTPANERIYDFGRYRQLFSEDIGLGVQLHGADSPRGGEGILNVWTNFEAYIAAENNLGRQTWGYKYWLLETQANAVNSFYDSLVANAVSIKRNSSDTYKAYKLKTDYFALGPNCTTLSIEGAKQAIPQIDEGSEKFIDPSAVLSFTVNMAMRAKYGVPSKIFLPDNLHRYFDTGPKIAAEEKHVYGNKK